jgi:hypothetical protein
MSYFEFEETRKSNIQNIFIESFIKDSIKEINENLIQDDTKNNIINSNNNKLNHDDIISKLKGINKGLTSLHDSITNNNIFKSTNNELTNNELTNNESTNNELTNNGSTCDNIILKLQEIDDESLSMPAQEDIEKNISKINEESSTIQKSNNDIFESTNNELNPVLIVNEKKKKPLNFEKINQILENNENNELPNVTLNELEHKIIYILENFNTKLNVELAKNIIFSKEILNDQTRENKIELILNKVVCSFENLLINK